MSDRKPLWGACREPGRRNGWTTERQLHFLDALERTKSVREAAACAGMSRESAYRLRRRCEGALFAALWDRAIAAGAIRSEGHTPALTDGRLARLLGNHFRRESGEFRSIGSSAADERRC